MTRRAFSPSSLRWLVLASLVAGLSACKREEVQRTRVGKDMPLSQTGLPEGHPPTGGAAAPAAVPANIPLGWTLPKGWTSVATTGMRVATLKPATGEAEVSVITLSGAAGGELANVNRWRGQLGLAPVDEKALGAMRQTVTAKAGKVQVYDLTSDSAPKNRMVVGMLATPGGDSWFLKMTGPDAAVAKAKAEFLALLETLRLEQAR